MKNYSLKSIVIAVFCFLCGGYLLYNVFSGQSVEMMEQNVMYSTFAIALFMVFVGIYNLATPEEEIG